MATALIQPRTSFRCDRTVPGDKSISHRAALFAALSNGTVRLNGFSTGADTASTLNGLRALGVRIEQSGSGVVIHGVGLRALKSPKGPLDCGNSGTTARLLAGVLSAQPFESELIGDASLSRRPMGRIIEPLRKMGATIECSSGQTLPMKIKGRSLKAIEYSLPVPSAQIKSCLLLAGLYAEGSTIVHEAIPSRDHTERLLPGVVVKNEDGKRSVSISKTEGFSFPDMNIPGDPSSAAFLLAAGVMVPNSSVTIHGVSLNPTRTGFLEVLKRMGAEIHVEATIDGPEPVGTVTVSSAVELSGLSLDGDIVSNVIDEIPILAVLGTQCRGGLTVRNASELRHKECDRIRAIAINLKAMGVNVEEYDDGFKLAQGPIRGAELDSFDDHRIAMAFSIAGMAAQDGETLLHRAECARISYPEFYDTCQIKLVSQPAMAG